MILPLVFKSVSLLIAVYSGVSFGYTIMERRRATVKKKLRIFSQFNERVNLTDIDDDKRYSIDIPQDIVVEKLRARVAKEEAEKSADAVQIAEPPAPNVPTVFYNTEDSQIMARFMAVK